MPVRCPGGVREGGGVQQQLGAQRAQARAQLREPHVVARR